MTLKSELFVNNLSDFNFDLISGHLFQSRKVDEIDKPPMQFDLQIEIFSCHLFVALHRRSIGDPGIVIDFFECAEARLQFVRFTHLPHD